MKFERNKKYTTIAIYAILTSMAILVLHQTFSNWLSIAGFVQKIIQLLSPLTYGFVLAYLLNPMLKTIEGKLIAPISRSRWKKSTRRGIAMLVTYLLALVIISVFAWIVIPQVGVGISSIVNKMPGYIKSLQEVISGLLANLPYADIPADIRLKLEEGLQMIVEWLYQVIGQLLPMLMSYTSRLTTSILNVVLGIIISVYLLSGKEKFFAQLKKGLYALLPTKAVEKVLTVADSSNRIFSGFIIGKLLDSLIIGILCFCGMTLLNMPSVMLVSLIVGVTNVIPYFGPFIGAIPGILIVMIDDPIKAVWFGVFVVVLQQFDGNILGPKILGDSTGLSGFWVIFAILLFGGLFGVLGMFIGVPLFAVIYSLIREFVNGRLERKAVPASAWQNSGDVAKPAAALTPSTEGESPVSADVPEQLSSNQEEQEK